MSIHTRLTTILISLGALLSIPHALAQSVPATGSNEARVANGIHYVSQWCAKTETLDDTCFSKAIADIAANGPAGSSGRRMGSLEISPGVYTFNSTVTVPLGVNISIHGAAQDSLWGVYIKPGPSNPNLFTILADSVTMQNITFQGNVKEDAIVLGSKANALYDTHINWCWFNSFSSGIHIINGGGLDLSHNTFEYNTFGISSLFPSGDVLAADIIASDLRAYKNSNGAVNISGDGSSKFGNNQFSGIYDFNGGSGYPQVNLYAVTDTQVSGNFNNGFQDDLAVWGVSRNVLIGPIVAYNSGRNTITANSVTNLTVANVSAHNTNVNNNTGITAVVNAGNITGLTVTGLTSTADQGKGLAAYGIYVDPTSTNVDIHGNRPTAQTNAAYDVLSSSGGTNILNELTVENDSAAPEPTTIEVLGQVKVEHPKQLSVIMSPATNTLSLQAAQSGVGYNQTLALNPSGGPVTVNTKAICLDDGTNCEIPYGTPGSSSTVCSQGQTQFDATYLYVCVAANSWRRVAISSF